MFEDPTMMDPAGAPPFGGEQTQQMPEVPFGGPPAVPFADATQQAISVQCGVCQTPNPPGERWCRDCGFLLGSAVEDLPELPDAATLPRLVAAGNGGREHSLQPGENSVGRENTDVLLPDAQVSRSHARLQLSEAALTVEDLGSTNGTYVAGRRLDAGEVATVFDGDEVRFGGVRLRALLPGFPSRPAEVTEAIPMEAEAGPPVDRGAPVALLQGDEGREFPLYEGTNTIGRRSQNDVCLIGDPYVSGKHAEIRCEEDSVVLIDIGSTNGTFIAGERMGAGVERPIAIGETVQFGKTRVTLAAAPEAPDAVDATVALEEPPGAEPALEDAGDEDVRSIDIP